MTLEELMELYGVSMERQSRLMKTVAAAMGADISDDGNSGQSNDGVDLNNQNDFNFLPISLGYETIE